MDASMDAVGWFSAAVMAIDALYALHPAPQASVSG